MISLDIETTGLDPERHEAWEVGLVALDGNAEYRFEFSVQDLDAAEAGALQVNNYYTRNEIPSGVDRCVAEGPGVPTAVWTEQDGVQTLGISPSDACYLIARLTAGQQFIGFNVGSFDVPFLAALLRRHGYAPAWKHRHLELGSFAAAALKYDRPLASVEVARLLVHGPDEAHTALGDARWNVTVYRRLVAIVEGRN